MTKVLNSVMVLMLTLLCFEAQSQCSTTPVEEAVRNGNFELGYLPGSTIGSPVNSHTFTPGSDWEFESDLRYAGKWKAGNGPCLYGMADQYGVGRVQNPACKFGGKQIVYGQYTGANRYKDHTTGTQNGFAMFVDFNHSTPNFEVVWGQEVNVYPSQLYYFSSWFAQYGGNQAAPTLRFRVKCYDAGGNLLETKNVGTAPVQAPSMVWQQFNGSYNTPANAATAKIYIECRPTGNPNQDDFMIDDISFINGCQNISSQIAYQVEFADNSASLCYNDGSYTAQILKDNQTPLGGGKTITWYEGTGATQTELTALANQEAPVITTPGTYRACVIDPANSGCTVNSEIEINKDLSVSLPATAELCDPAEITLNDGRSETGLTHTWTIPSGVTPSTNRTQLATKAGNYDVTVEHPSVNGCTASASTAVTSLLPSANLPAYCIGDPVQLSKPNGSWKWFEDNKTTLIGNQSGGNPITWANAPQTVGMHQVSLQDASTSPLSTIVGQNWAFEGDGTNMTINVQKPVVLQSVQLRLAGWAGTKNVVIKIGGAAPQNFTRSVNGTKTVNINKLLTPGNWTINYNAGGEYMINNPAGSIPGFVTVSGNGGKGSFKNLKFAEANACEPVLIDIEAKLCCTLPTITSQPSNQSTCEGSAATFSVATSSSNPSYAWEVSQDNGSTWNTASGPDYSGINSSTLSVTGTSSNDQLQVRAIVTSGGCPLNSDEVTLTVNPLPNASITTSGTDLEYCSNESGVSLTAQNVNGATYTWKESGSNQGSNNPLSSATAGSWTVEVQDGNNCVATSSAVTVVENALPIASITTSGSDLEYCSGIAGISLEAGPVVGGSFEWFNGSTSSGTTNPIAGATAGAWTVQVTDANNCVATSSVVTVVENALPPVQITTSGTDLRYCQGSVGTTLAASTVSGATYEWFKASTSSGTGNPLVGAEAGTWTVALTDGNNCTSISSPVTVIENSLPEAVLSGSGSICNDGSTESLQVDISNGSGPYDFEILLDGSTHATLTDESSPYVFSSADNGTYTLAANSLIDDNGCVGTVSGSGSIDYHDEVVANTTLICQKDDASLSSEFVYIVEMAVTVGDLSSTITNTTATITSGTDQGNTITWTDMGGGVWRSNEINEDSKTSLDIADGNSCNTVSFVDLQQKCSCPAQVDNFSLNTSTICPEGSTQLNVTISGGSGDYNVDVTLPDNTALSDNGSTGSSQFSVDQEGQYAVSVVSNGEGCSISGPTVSLTHYDSPTISIAATKADFCYGEDQGKVTLLGLAGLGDWTVTMDTGSSQTSTQFTIPSSTGSLEINTTSSGNYVVTSITDANSCVAQAGDLGQSVSLNGVVPPVAAIDGIACGDIVNSGTETMDLDPSSSINLTSYNIQWTSTGQGSIDPTTGLLSGLTTSYDNDAQGGSSQVTLTVTDQNSVCASQQCTVEIRKRLFTQALAGGDAETCLADASSFSRVGNLGIAGVNETWGWSTPLPTGFTSSNETLSGSSAVTTGQHTFTYWIYNPIQDDTTKSSFTLTVNDVPDVSSAILSGPSNLCQGLSGTYEVTGAVNADANGYSWQAPSGFSGAGSGLTESVSILFGGNTGGFIEASASNYCGSASLSPIAVSVDLIPQSLPSIGGLTQVCGAKSYDYSISNPSTDADSYTWMVNGSSFLSNANTSSTINLSANELQGASNVNIELIPVNSCGNGASATMSISVESPQMPLLDIAFANGDDKLCIDLENIVVNATSTNSGTSPQYRYKQGNGSFGNWTTSTSYAIDQGDWSDNETITVELLPDTASGCINLISNPTTSLIVDGYNIPTGINLNASSSAICESAGSITMTVQGLNVSNGDEVINWLSPASSSLGITSHSHVVTNSTERGTYTVIVSNPECAGPQGEVTATTDVMIYEQPVIAPFSFVNSNDQLAISIDAGGNSSDPTNYNVNVSGLSQDLGNSDTYTWSSEAVIIDEDQKDLDFQVVGETNETLTLTVTNGTGNATCTDVRSLSLIVSLPINVPNVFSPNGDGINDAFRIQGMGKYQDAHIAIFNRWGNMVFEKYGGYQSIDAWDGQSLPAGTYYYTINLNDPSRKEIGLPEQLTGYITLMR